MIGPLRLIITTKKGDNMIKKFLLSISVLALVGCGAHTAHFVKEGANTSRVTFQVNLDREFIKTISSLSGGQAAMLILVGPFTNNAVLLVASHKSASVEEVAFRQRLSWGNNNFSANLEKGKSYNLVVVVQGTRSGMKEIGQIVVKDTPEQSIQVQLREEQVGVTQT